MRAQLPSSHPHASPANSQVGTNVLYFFSDYEWRMVMKYSDWCFFWYSKLLKLRHPISFSVAFSYDQIRLKIWFWICTMFRIVYKKMLYLRSRWFSTVGGSVKYSEIITFLSLYLQRKILYFGEVKSMPKVGNVTQSSMHLYDCKTKERSI